MLYGTPLAVLEIMVTKWIFSDQLVWNQQCQSELNIGHVNSNQSRKLPNSKYHKNKKGLTLEAIDRDF